MIAWNTMLWLKISIFVSISKEVLKAGTYTANYFKDDGMPKFAEYNGVRVGIYLDNEGYPSTIFPDGGKQP